VVARSDKILPYYVLDVAADVPGLPGLFLAGLVSAGLSTMSAGLNTVTGTVYEDFIDPWMPESNDKETKAANIMKVQRWTRVVYYGSEGPEKTTRGTFPSLSPPLSLSLSPFFPFASSKRIDAKATP